MIKRTPTASETTATGTPSALPRAQEVGLVCDIYTGEKSSEPAQLTKLDHKIYFTADDGQHGRELWQSDGSTTGTQMVTDINRIPVGQAVDQDTSASKLTDHASPSSLTAINGKLYFAADDGQHGKELWKSDGSAGGTVMIKDINTSTTDPAASSSLPAYLTAVSKRLFFTANDGQHGTELWLSDGTASGTHIVQDIHPGPGNASPNNLTAIGTTLYFSATDGEHGYEVWKSDGTANGTIMLADINPQGNAYPSAFTRLGDSLYFTADDGVNNRELWKSDGTEIGTKMVRDINTTPAINGGKSIASGLLVVNDKLYFSADDGRNGIELWSSDGTLTGTQMVRDINPASSNPSELTNVSGSLYFTADDGIHGAEIWKSDGSESGTIMIKDINLHADIKDGNSYPSSLTASQGRLFFVADNGGGSGEELWQTDGTPEGTIMIRDISNDPSTNAGGSNPRDLVNIENMLFFSAYRVDYGRELYRFH